MLERVVDQVAQRDAQRIDVPQHRGRGRVGDQPQLVPLVARLRELVDDHLRELPQVDGLALQRDTGVDAGDLQQPGGQVGEPVELAHQGLGAVAGPVVAGFLGQPLCLCAGRCKRGAQLMGHLGGKTAFGGQQGLHADHEPVDRLQQRMQLGGGVLHRQGLQVMGGTVGQFVLDGLQLAEGLAQDQVQGERRQGQQQQQRHQQREGRTAQGGLAVPDGFGELGAASLVGDGGDAPAVVDAHAFTGVWGQCMGRCVGRTQQDAPVEVHHLVDHHRLSAVTAQADAVDARPVSGITFLRQGIGQQHQQPLGILGQGKVLDFIRLLAHADDRGQGGRQPERAQQDEQPHMQLVGQAVAPGAGHGEAVPQASSR